MIKELITVAIRHFYNTGDITKKEKTRIESLPTEEALKIDLIRNEVEKLSKERGGTKIEDYKPNNMSETGQPNLSKDRMIFNEKYLEYGEKEVLMELLWAQQIQIFKLEKIRSNSSKLVWWLVAIPIIWAALGLYSYLIAFG